MLVKVFCTEGPVTTAKLKLGQGVARISPDQPLAQARNSTRRASKVTSGAAGTRNSAVAGLVAAAVMAGMLGL